MIVHVAWQSYDEKAPARGYWDYKMLDELLHNEQWLPVSAHMYVHHEGERAIDAVPPGEGAVVVLPARYHTRKVEQINEDIARLPWVVLILAGDEESVFPVKEIRHPNIVKWIMTPIPFKNSAKENRFLIHGYPPDADLLREYDYMATETRPLKFFFSGQVTHARRRQCFAAIERDEDGIGYKTDGFTKGVDHPTYYRYMASAKCIPCPSGPKTPDSFRLAEALEAGCVPIADNCTPDPNYPPGYWQAVFGEQPPFPIIDDWSHVREVMESATQQWPRMSNRCFAWWQGKKRQLRYDLRNDINKLNGMPTGRIVGAGQVTVLIPTSPIPSNPNTGIIEETIASVRYHFPLAEILIMIDGVRGEQENRRAQYEEYKRRLLWLCNTKFTNVLPIVFEEHMHQVGMTRAVLKKVETPLILFVEHDTPLVASESAPIKWNAIIKTVEDGTANVVRLLHETQILADHEYLTLNEVRIHDAWFVKTIQWSQRPHVASTEYYEKILAENFSEHCSSMIEDKMHGVVQANGREGWDQHRLMIYAPRVNMKRSLHTNGRESDPKFEMTF